MCMIRINYTETGENIHRMREDLGFTMQDAAKKIGVAPGNIGKYESGKSVPTLEKAIALSELFGVTVNELISYEAD